MQCWHGIEKMMTTAGFWAFGKTIIIMKPESKDPCCPQ
jgi:hypothetical protein